MIRLSADEVSAARQQPIASVVSAVVPLDRHGFGLCPFHDERTPSFHVHLKRNKFKCFGCGAGGDCIDFVRLTRRVDFCSAVQILLGGVHGNPNFGRGKAERQVAQYISNESPRTQGNLLEFVRRLWDTADAPSIAEFYLQSRGIRLRPRPLPESIRGTRKCWCSETQQYRPALLAAVTVCDSVVAVQRIWTEETYISDDPKGAKGKLAAPKKNFGRMGHGAVQLANPLETLGIAEGVETAMSAEALFRMPVWASLGAQRMGSLELPEIVKTVVIFGDNGEAGGKAASDARRSYLERGYTVDTAFPKNGFGDFNNQLTGRR